MSTIKSSSEHLTLNADGVGKEIKLQNNGTTNVTVASDGNLGVGTSSPYAKLHIQGSNYSVTSGGDADTGLRFSGGTTGIDTYTNGLSFSYGSGSSAISGVQSGSDTDRIGISFFTHPSSTGTASAVEQMRIHHDGYLINPNGITLGTADASTFASANTLDDYEEGTFGNTEAGWTVDGRYVKIGRIVWVSGQATLSSATTNRFMHMPFSSTNEIGTGTQAGNILRNTSSTYATSDYVAVYSTTNDLYVYSSSGSTRGTPSNGVFSFNFWYPTNS